MTLRKIDFDKIRDACHVTNGQLRCDACNKRIASKIRTGTYEPKYPFCPWCGAPVSVDAQRLRGVL